MKVAVNTRFLLPRLEGIGTFTHEICKRLVLQNPKVEFHFLFDRDFDKKYLYGENVIPQILFPPARHPLLWKIWYEWAVPRYLKKTSVDVFFSPDNYCSLSTDVPTVMVTHDLAFEHFPEHIKSGHLSYFRKYSRRFHQRADKIACVSEYTRQDVIRKYGIDKTKTLLTYNGCSTTFKALSHDEKAEVKNKYSNGEDYLLSIGALHPRKNLVKLVQAFEIYKKSHPSKIKLVLIGRKAWKTDALMSTIHTSSVRDDVVLLGFIDDLAGILSSAKALCYPSLFEGFGIPILEAFHAGIPVLTSNVSSMPEIGGNAVVLTDPSDIRSISNGLQAIVQDVKLREDLIVNGLKRTQLYSWDNSANNIMKAFREIC